MLTEATGVYRVSVLSAGGSNNLIFVGMICCGNYQLRGKLGFGGICVGVILVAGLAVPMLNSAVLLTSSLNTRKVRHRMLVDGNQNSIRFQSSNVIAHTGNHAVNLLAEILGNYVIARGCCAIHKLAVNVPCIGNIYLVVKLGYFGSYSSANRWNSADRKSACKIVVLSVINCVRGCLRNLNVHSAFVSPSDNSSITEALGCYGYLCVLYRSGYYRLGLDRRIVEYGPDYPFDSMGFGNLLEYCGIAYVGKRCFK